MKLCMRKNRIGAFALAAALLLTLLCGCGRAEKAVCTGEVGVIHE